MPVLGATERGTARTVASWTAARWSPGETERHWEILIFTFQQARQPSATTGLEEQSRGTTESPGAPGISFAPTFESNQTFPDWNKIASYSFCYVVIMLLLLKNINIPCSHFKFEIKIYVITFSLFYYVSNLDYIMWVRERFSSYLTRSPALSQFSLS